METLNILQLQLNESLLNTEKSSIRSVSFSDEKIKLFKDKMIEFLGGNSTIQISNKNSAQKKDDGFIVLTISSEGLIVLDSSSIKKSEYKFLFKNNSLLLNDRTVDISFLDSFIRKIMFVASRVEEDEYEIIKV
jgi:hypothetical protein